MNKFFIILSVLLIFMNSALALSLQCNQGKLEKDKTYLDAENLIIIGDSTVAWYDPTHKIYGPRKIKGWGMTLGDYFKKSVSIRNFARSGADTSEFLDSKWDSNPLSPMDRALDCLDSKTKLFLIQFGHNDDEDNIPRYKSNLKKMIKAIKEKSYQESTSVDIILVTPMVRRTFSGSTVKNKLEIFADSMIHVVNALDDARVNYIDLNKLTENYNNNIGKDRSTRLNSIRDSEIPTDLSYGSDTTHHNLQGATVYAKIISNELKKLNINSINDLLPSVHIDDGFEVTPLTSYTSDEAIHKHERWVNITGYDDSQIIQGNGINNHNESDSSRFYTGYNALRLKTEEAGERTLVRIVLAPYIEGNYRVTFNIWVPPVEDYNRYPRATLRSVDNTFIHSIIFKDGVIDETNLTYKDSQWHKVDVWVDQLSGTYKMMIDNRVDKITDSYELVNPHTENFGRLEFDWTGSGNSNSGVYIDDLRITTDN